MFVIIPAFKLCLTAWAVLGLCYLLSSYVHPEKSTLLVTSNLTAGGHHPCDGLYAALPQNCKPVVFIFISVSYMIGKL
jgi:hypothetical protein